MRWQHRTNLHNWVHYFIHLICVNNFKWMYVVLVCCHFTTKLWMCCKLFWCRYTVKLTTAYLAFFFFCISWVTESLHFCFSLTRTVSAAEVRVPLGRVITCRWSVYGGSRLCRWYGTAMSQSPLIATSQQQLVRGPIWGIPDASALQCPK